VVSIDCDVRDAGFCLFESGSKLIEILWIGRCEVGAPWFDLVDLEFLDDVRGEILDVDSMRGDVGAFVVGTVDEMPEGVRGDGNALPSFVRKWNIRGGLRSGACQ